jgi:hypothetical protein
VERFIANVIITFAICSATLSRCIFCRAPLTLSVPSSTRPPALCGPLTRLWAWDVRAEAAKDNGTMMAEDAGSDLHASSSRGRAEQRSVAVGHADLAAVPVVAAGAPHVFISYVREDSGEVDALQRALEVAGVRVWRDTSDLWPGEDWRSRIRDAIAGNALAFIACFSRHSTVRDSSHSK